MEGGRTLCSIVVIVVVTLCTIGWCRADTSVTLEVDNELVEEGGDFTIICKANHNPPKSFIRWEKVGSGGRRSTIAVNGILESKYANLAPFRGSGKRYHASASEGDEEDQLISTLKITGAVVDDAGTIRCDLPVMTKSEEVQITVLKSSIVSGSDRTVMVQLPVWLLILGMILWQNL